MPLTIEPRATYTLPLPSTAMAVMLPTPVRVAVGAVLLSYRRLFNSRHQFLYGLIVKRP